MIVESTSSTGPARVAWLIELNGHSFDLEDQLHWTSGNPIHVARGDEERYYLLLPIALVGEDHKKVRDRAEHVVVALNGIGGLFEPAYAGITLANVMHTVDETGVRRDVVIGVTGVAMRIRGGRPTVVVGGQQSADPTRGMAAAVMSAADGSTAMHDALSLLGRPTPTWSELFVAYELVKANVGGLMHELRWVSKAELRLFKWTANSYTALGPQARHGSSPDPAPNEPMSYADARDLIRRLVRSWVSQTDPEPRK